MASSDEEFIKRELLPEMVYNRCFCEPGSREFVEFESMEMDTCSCLVSFDSDDRDSPYVYEAPFAKTGPFRHRHLRAVIRFSGEPRSFPLFLKTLPVRFENDADDDDDDAWRAFQNEELFYNKMASLYRLDSVATCYVADLGKYGRPVLVLEDLQANDYIVSRDIDGSFYGDNDLYRRVQVVGAFHAAGLRLKAKEPSAFRELVVKLQPRNAGTARAGEQLRELVERYSRIGRLLESSGSVVTESALREMIPGYHQDQKNNEDKLDKEIKKDELKQVEEGDDFVTDFSTICHGALSRESFLIRNKSETKLVGFQSMRLASPALDLATLVYPTFDADEDVTSFVLRDYMRAVSRACALLNLEAFSRHVRCSLPVHCADFALRNDHALTDEGIVDRILNLERELGGNSR